VTAPQDPVPVREIRVLVVEDEPVASRAHQAYVGRVDGFRVVGAAASARDAERLLRAGPVDLVLLDLHLPDGHGLELLRRVRAAGSTVDVMVVSSARDAEVVRSAVAQGAVQYVLKPFTAATLRDRLLAYRRFRDQVVEPAGSGALDQIAVDQALAALRTAGTGSALPKGLTAPTLAAVAAALRAAGECSAQELATRLDVSRITARRYLEHLVDTGAAERTLRYGQVGRPETRYRSVRG
jgi:response regulator of citrate/malate metabolism